MPIILVGLNHNTAPVELRELIALEEDALSSALADLSHISPLLSEGVILSTCNRLEVYSVTQDIAAGRMAVDNFLSRLQGISPAVLKPHLYFKHDQDAVQHLMRVASGLDSLILGESQILGQVADAFSSARAASVTGSTLSQLFSGAIRAGKRARSETDISRHTTSVSHAAALLAREQTSGLENAHVLVVGAGEMAELAAQALQQRGAVHITCINRTYSSAEALVAKINGQAIAWNDLISALAEADVVISATGAPHTVIHVKDVAPALIGRADRPLIFIDIAVPRDVEEAVGNLQGVARYDIDSLHAVLDENMAQRESAVPHVEAIINEEVAAFAGWMNRLEIVPVIADLHAYAAHIAQTEVKHTLETLTDAGTDTQKAIELLAHRLVNKLLHAPTAHLREQAERGNGYTYAHVVRELFDLNESQYQPNHIRKNGNGRKPDSIKAKKISGD
jgi:glutamyl-tRNA reductase